MPSDGARFRVGTHYGIHIYEGDVPVATALTVEYARMIVAALNAQFPTPSEGPLEDFAPRGHDSGIGGY